MRYAIYARVSTAMEEQKSSYDVQVDDLKKRVSILYPDLKFFSVYGDRGVSGTKENRPAFDEMLEDARNGCFECIVTKSISRFARNTKLLLSVLEELQKLKVRVIFLEENLDTEKSSQKFVMTVLGALAEMESQNLREHIKEGFAIRRDAGKMARPQAIAYGYKLENHVPVVDEEKAKVVRQIFSWFVDDNLSPGGIVSRLMERGIPASRGGSRWHRNTIQFLLKNKKYVGSAEEKDSETGKVYEFPYPSIVDVAVFEKAQEIIALREKDPRVEKMRAMNSNFKPSIYPLSGLGRCALCGSLITRFTTHSEAPRHSCDLEDACNGHPVWGCIEYSGSRKRKGFCGSYKVSEQYVYECIVSSISYAIRRGWVNDLLSAVKKASVEDSDYEELFSVYKMNKKSLENKKKKLRDLYVEGLYSLEETADAVKKIDRELSKLKKPVAPKISQKSIQAVNILSEAAEKFADGELFHDRGLIRALFADPMMKRNVVLGVVEWFSVGGDPKYSVQVKLRNFDEVIHWVLPRRCPWKRGSSLLYELPKIKIDSFK